ncbi:AraC family transcriptional regulator [Derxia gummosa]|uniref:AraC family transcriptional regulator n=1 Tax=Derxia gummosa DSM 723 TaxID=1121388 RepID=A0A8B6X9F1_9BURK|nr:AraC family transcriptional regulator [Derxia gummosa]
MLNTPPCLPAATAVDPLEVIVLRAELASHIERLTRQRDGAHESVIPRVWFARLSHANHPQHVVHEPALCVLAQGSKRVLLGSDVYVYDPNQFLVVSQNLPVASQVIDATPESPYLGVRIDLDPKEITSLALELGERIAPPTCACQRGISTGDLTPSLLDAVLRLVRLADTPADIALLAPLIQREILYRLLTSPLGWKLAQLAAAESNSHRIARAINWLRANFDAPLRIDELAREVHMSASSLHHHFKAVTAMSPLQYQKQLRLQEARRVMLAEHVDAGTASRRVGYESQSQFTREYSRFFGEPPVRDIRRLREAQMRG